MTAIFEMPIQSETLDGDEIANITGSKLRPQQLDWLDKNHWMYHKNRAGTPIVGRLYARLKMAGISTSTLTTGGWTPDFSAVK